MQPVLTCCRIEMEFADANNLIFLVQYDDQIERYPCARVLCLLVERVFLPGAR